MCMVSTYRSLFIKLDRRIHIYFIDIIILFVYKKMIYMEKKSSISARIVIDGTPRNQIRSSKLRINHGQVEYFEKCG